jgi:hypothetical protein
VGESSDIPVNFSWSLPQVPLVKTLFDRTLAFLYQVAKLAR